MFIGEKIVRKWTVDSFRFQISDFKFQIVSDYSLHQSEIWNLKLETIPPIRRGPDYGTGWLRPGVQL
jgi:abortive infection bacteriophage resistance protein